MNTTVSTNSTGQVIWDCIVSLREAGQAISRQRLMELTDFPYTKVDDHVSRWIEEGRMRRLVDGVYEVVDPLPEPRAISVTDLHNSMVLIEIGDQELRLFTPEARALARQLGGFALQYAQLQTQNDVAALLVEATVRNRALADRISDMERAQATMARRLKDALGSQQMELMR
ncbi:hypothetical protein [Comamonas sp. B-9]|uniref:hypothetical protein n=1 Tax=Comamonas sp. B-9 TaxID=1055192 RepID=UPI0011DDD130|nr:hypothetical protein [Comamonas sp. B-9]